MNQLQSPRISSFYSIFLTFLLLSPTYPFSWYSSTILIDLEGTGEPFKANANEWTVKDLRVITTRVTSCAGVYLLGGYNVLNIGMGNYFERKYTGLPDHNLISFSFQFYAIDGWDGPPDNFQISFDDIPFSGFEIDNGNSPPFTNRCGRDKPDVPPITVLANFPHTGSTVTIRVISQLNNYSNEESFGFRQIIMEFRNVAVTQQWICGISDMALPYNWCLCEDGKYIDPPQTGKCANCDPSCATCATSGSTNCLSCHSGFYLSAGQCLPCVSPCVKCTGSSNGQCLSCTTGLFLIGKTCYNTCDPPLQPSTISGILYCGRECATSVTLWDGSCATTCDSPPLTPDTVNGQPTCKFPCATNEFVYWDGSCDIACPAPLIKQYANNRKFCTYPCSGSQIAYWNGECIDNCVLPFQIEIHSNYDVCVSSCAGNLFLYPNGSCISNCQQPYSPSVVNTAYFCDFTCDPGSYYLPATHSCISPCPSGYYQSDQDRVCLACKDPFCSQCSATGATCSQCRDGAILDSDGICKQCESLKTQYLRPIGSDSHEYNLILIPDYCDLATAFVKSQLFSTSEAKEIFPPFSLKASYVSPHTYRVRVTFNASVLEPANLGILITYLSGSLAVPKTLIPSELAKALEEVAPAVTAAIATTMGTSFGATFAMGASTTMWSMLSFQQFIGYFIYLNIDYPPQLETFLSFFSFTDWDFLPNPIASLTESWKEDLSLDESSLEGESRYQLPSKFVKYEVSPFFIDNGGSLITINLIMLIAPLMLHQLRRFRVLNIDRFLWKLMMNLRWNGIFRAFLENSIPMLFATLIQIKKFSFDNVYVAISTILATLSFSYLTMMLHFIWNTLKAQSKHCLERPMVKLSYGTLYEGLELKDSVTKYYHLLIMLRGFLLIFLVIFLDVHPILQIVPLIFYNICILWYLLKRNIFEDSKMNIINKIKEALIVVGEIFILCLCLKNKSNSYYQVLGWLALSTFSLATLVELAYLVILQIIELIQGIKKLWRLLFSKKKVQIKKVFCVRDEKIEPQGHRKYSRIKVKINRDRQRNIYLNNQLANLTSEIFPLEGSQN